MEAKHKVGETIRIPLNRTTGDVSMVIGLVTSQKELLDYNGLENDENFPECKNECVIYSEETNIEKVWNNFLGNWVYEDDILDDDEVLIKNDIDPHCKVWHNDKCIGIIKNTTALDDFLVQLKRKFDAGEDVSGYYIEYYEKQSGETIKLYIDTEYFTIDNTPEGFYDNIDKSMKEMCGF